MARIVLRLEPDEIEMMHALEVIGRSCAARIDSIRKASHLTAPDLAAAASEMDSYSHALRSAAELLRALAALLPEAEVGAREAS